METYQTDERIIKITFNSRKPRHLGKLPIHKFGTLS
jgi:hypothetical protein